MASDINDPSRRCGNQAGIFYLAKNQVFPRVFSYTFDTRAYQDPSYDPYDYCNPKSAQALATGAYGLCHEGDLLPVFNVSFCVGQNTDHSSDISALQTYGAIGLAYRDALDLPWSRNVADQWTAFARWHDPYVQPAYLAARRYGAGPAQRWTATLSDPSNPQTLSIGPQQYMQPLAQQGAQCDIFGKGLNYILNQQGA